MFLEVLGRFLPDSWTIPEMHLVESLKALESLLVDTLRFFGDLYSSSVELLDALGLVLLESFSKK